MNRWYAEARRSAESGLSSPGPVGIGDTRFIPGLYGLKFGGWVQWDADRAVRLARVDAFFGVA